MSMIKEREYNNFDDDDAVMEENEDFIDSELDIENDETDSFLIDEENIRFRRTWRDTEKYKEMRELYKTINDELYTGFEEEDFLEDEDGR